jgi:two-component system, LytTR family, response regulator
MYLKTETFTPALTIDVLVVDDEMNVRSVIKRLLADFFPDTVRVVAEAANVSDAYAKIVQYQPGLVLLDIEMQGESGFQLLERFEQISFDVIFVTSYDQYAIKAIKFSALDYLLKPLMLEEFRTAIHKALLRRDGAEDRSKNMEVLRQNTLSNRADERIILNQKTRTEAVYCRDVVWLEGNVNYTIVHMSNEKKHFVAKTLKEFEEMLCQDKTGFIRIHKVCIVNVRYIDKMIPGQAVALQLKNGTKLEISRRKKAEVLLQLSAFNIR